MTFVVDLGLLSVFVGLAGIALTILFGIRPQIGKITTALEAASKDVAAVRQKVDVVLDLLVQRSGGAAGGATVTLQFKHLGEVKISASLGSEETEYVVQTEQSSVRADFVIRLSKTTGLEAKAREIFADNVPKVSDLAPGKLLVRLPSTDAHRCTKYMRQLVDWLESVYLDNVEKERARFERPILGADEALKS